MASCSTATMALLLSRKPLLSPPPSPSSSLLSWRHHLIALQPTTSTGRSAYSSDSTNGVVCCLVSGVGGGGGVSDTRRSEFSREFSRGFAVIANMLKRIEPLDTSDIAQGVSDSAKDSMKQTISTMLGLLPSDQFSVSVRVSKLPLRRLLSSAIITGYTLWNAEYRISLLRNFELPFDSSISSNLLEETEISEANFVGVESGKGEACVEDHMEGLSQSNHHTLEGFSPEAMSYIHQLEEELRTAKKELDEQKREYMEMESKKRDDNNLLQYLTSLDSDMVTELSQPSSMEVKEVTHELVQNILQRFFKDETTFEHVGDRTVENSEEDQDGVRECYETTSTSRDYLGQLLFWCMLLGYHLRRLENRLHLSCAVGLL
ncbi:hypothetical protein Ancab_034343 [Ancistrocladus abbreviatus]